MESKFAFLTSIRFYASVFAALSVYLTAKGYIGEAERNLIITIVGSFVTIKTIDRNVGDKKVQAAAVSSGFTIEQTDARSVLEK